MSGTDFDPAKPVGPAASAGPDEGFAVPLKDFAAAIGPRPGNINMPVGRGTRRMRGLLPGEADEVWLTLLRIYHGVERHTVAGWRRLIDTYRDQPAHPHHPDYGKDSEG